MISPWIPASRRSAPCAGIRQRFRKKARLVYTAGTTPDPDKALIRALTEVAQLAGDFHTEANYVASGLPKPLSLEEVEYVVRPEKVIALRRNGQCRRYGFLP